MFDEKEFYKTVGNMFGKDPAELSRETKIKEDLKATSQMLFGVSAMLEKLTGKKVTFADINNCATLGDAIALTEK